MLKVERLRAGYGPLTIISDVSLEVMKGEIGVILGANNAGKTTLLKSMVGLIKPQAGMVSLNGEDLTPLPPHEIVSRGLVMIPQNRGIFPRLTVEENLFMGGFNPRARKKRKQNLEWVYTLFPFLKERRRQMAGTLSGGEQQMLAIGRGVMAEPEVLLLDEPLSGLSPILIAQVSHILRELNREGLTILLVEHNLKAALSLSKRAYVLFQGEISLSGESKALMADEQVIKAYLGIGR